MGKIKLKKHINELNLLFLSIFDYMYHILQTINNPKYLNVYYE